MTSAAEQTLYADGPWTHRQIAANGQRFHLVESGEGPLVMLLHGFPEFWWAWRHQIPALADAGVRVVAVDLRGFGASDKPPRGYDLTTAAADIAGLIRALGEREAMVVGHGQGGLIAWTAAALVPGVVRRLAVVGAPHPLRLRTQFLTQPRGQLRASWYVAAVQVPRAESYLRRDDAEAVIRLVRSWSGPGWPDLDTETRIRRAFLTGNTPHCALEYYRWAIRSLVRPDGMRYARRVATPVRAPVLQVHGELDRCLLPGTARGSDRYVHATYEWQLVPGVGHFVHEEAPEELTKHLLRWATSDIR